MSVVRREGGDADGVFPILSGDVDVDRVRPPAVGGGIGPGRLAQVLEHVPRELPPEEAIGPVDVDDLEQLDVQLAAVVEQHLVHVGDRVDHVLVEDEGPDRGPHQAHVPDELHRDAHGDDRVRGERSEQQRQPGERAEEPSPAHWRFTSTSTSPVSSSRPVMALPRIAPLARSRSATRMAWPRRSEVVSRSPGRIGPPEVSARA